MPPAAYLRIQRFNRALKRLRARPKEGLAEAALSLGFADQSHLARDLRELGGVTATALQGHEPLALMSPAALSARQALFEQDDLPHPHALAQPVEAFVDLA